MELKGYLQRIAVSNIHVYLAARWLVGQLPMMLPHDPDFHGLRKLADPTRTFLDVGANDGLSVRSMRHLCPSKPIFSIEPNPTHEPALLALKNKLKNFDFRLVGGGPTRSTLTLYTPVYRGHALTNYASMSPEAVWANLDTHMNLKGVSENIELKKHDVPVVPLDELDLDVDVIKIDVEGFEDSVVAGLAKTIDRCRPSLMIEYNPRSFTALRSFFAGRSYRVCRYLARADKFEDYGAGQILNVFFIPSERPA